MRSSAIAISGSALHGNEVAALKYADSADLYVKNVPDQLITAKASRESGVMKEGIANWYNSDKPDPDAMDIQILNLMSSGYSNKQISHTLEKPLSTIQRRTRKLTMQGLLRIRGEINYRKLGYRRGLFHVYLKGDGTLEVAEKIADIPGVLDVTLYVGNADIIGAYIFKDTASILTLVNQVKQMKSVDKVVWSEQVYVLPEKKTAIL